MRSSRRQALHLSGEELYSSTRRAAATSGPRLKTVSDHSAPSPLICDCDAEGELAVPADGWRVLSCVDSCRTVRQVASAAGMRVFETARWISRWIGLGVLTTDAKAATATDSGDHDGWRRAAHRAGASRAG